MEEPALNTKQILIAFEKLFGGGRGVERLRPSGLRYVKLPDGAMLIEQNLRKRTSWAKLARNGQRIAWVMRDGEYLAQVVNGQLVLLDKENSDEQEREKRRQ